MSRTLPLKTHNTRRSRLPKVAVLHGIGWPGQNRRGVRDEKGSPGLAEAGGAKEPAACDRCGALYSRRTWRFDHPVSSDLLERVRWDTAYNIRAGAQILLRYLKDYAIPFAERTGDRRFADLWRFVDEGRVDVYLQRILDHSACAAGYRFTDLEEKAKEGVDLTVTRPASAVTGRTLDEMVPGQVKQWRSNRKKK